MAVASLVPIAGILATSGVFFARRELWDILTLAGTLFCEVVAQILKWWAKDPRPSSCAVVDFCGTYGMPSSHAQLAAFSATINSLHLYRRLRGCRLRGDETSITTLHLQRLDPLVIASVSSSWPVAFVVAVSRVHLGYHSFEQVCVGFAIGFGLGIVWHAASCVIAAAAKEGLECRVVSNKNFCSVLWTKAVEFLNLRDSSLVSNPLEFQRQLFVQYAERRVVVECAY